MSDTPKPEILIIDDDPIVCESLESIIRGMGYYTATFQDAKRALEYFENEKNPVVLLDINLPSEGGLELLPKLKSVSPGSQIMMMTGSRDLESIVYSVANNASDYLLKPFSPKLVQHSIEKAFSVYKIIRDKEIQEESILRDLRLASKIQRKIFLHTDNSKYRIFTEVYPARYVSGDFVLTMNLNDDEIFMMMGDIEDHGVTSGLIAFLMIAVAREHIKIHNDPSIILEKLNQELIREVGTHSMSAIISIYNKKTKILRSSRGGHTFPIIIRSKEGKVEFQKERTGNLLGIMEDAKFENSEVSLQEGDLYLLYSDGLMNSTNHSLVSDLSHLGANKFEEAKEIIHRYAESQKGNLLDDLSFYLIEV